MSWIVVQIKPNSELKAKVNLVSQGFNVFFPKILRTVSQFNKIKPKIKPLFPGYLFVKLDYNKKYWKINYTVGVLRIVRFNSESLPFLPLTYFEEIKKRCDKDDLFSFEDELIKGNSVYYKVNESFFLKAIFEENIDSKRSYILLDFLNNKLKTKVLNKKIIPNF